MRVTFAALLVFLGSAVAAPVPKELKKKQTYFPTAVGTKWVYEAEDGSDNQTREVTAATEKDGVRTLTILWKANGTTQTWELKEDATGLYRSKMGANAIDPPHHLLKSKLTEGDEWEGEYTQSGGTVKYRRTVGRPEKVTVPAGEYTAVPVTQVDPDDPDDEATVWYAEGVGMVKLLQRGSRAMLLKSVTIGDAAKK
jgi:hypothetical protein